MNVNLLFMFMFIVYVLKCEFSQMFENDLEMFFKCYKHCLCYIILMF